MKQTVLLLLAAASLSGCSWLPWVGDDEEADKSKSLPPLEVPPELSVPEFDSRLSIPGETVQAARPAIAPAKKEPALAVDTAPSSAAPTAPVSVEVEPPSVVDALALAPATPPSAPHNARALNVDGVRWIEIGGKRSEVWAELKSFWEKQGVTLEKSSAKRGIMETAWITRNAGAQAGSEAYRDSFHLRLENEADSLTNVYISHHQSKRADGPKEKWVEIPHDPARETALVSQMLAFLGGQQPTPTIAVAHDAGSGTAKPQPASPTPLETAPQAAGPALRIDSIEGAPVLIVRGLFARIWEMTGDALTRTGLKVQIGDREQGIYLVQAQKRSLMARLFGKGDDEAVSGQYKIRLLDQGERTVITAHAEGKDSGDRSTRVVLERLEKEMAGDVDGLTKPGAQTARQNQNSSTFSKTPVQRLNEG